MASGMLQQLGGNKTLWEGTPSYMGGGITAALSEPISKQKHGIVLCWSAYVSGVVQNYDWVYNFLPKDEVKGNNHKGVGLFLSTANFSKVGGKYIYFDDSLLTGYASNDTTGTGSGITYANNYWVLRKVIGF